MLTSVEVGQGGVWLMCPPKLLFIPDRDGDLIPDGEPEVMLDGFDVARGNYHNFANGLRWGPDGWLYGRCGHSCPGRIGVPGTSDELRYPIDGGSGVIIRKERWLRCLLMERSIHGGMTGMSMGNSFLLIP